MDTINVSLEVFANYLGLNSSELSTALIVEKDGVKTPKPQSEIDNFLSSKLTDKVATANSKGKEEGQGWAKKETLKAVESFISENFGITEGNWEDRLKALKAKKPETKKGEITEEDVKSSQFFKTSIQTIKDELIQEREAHLQTKKQHTTEKVYTVAERKALNLLRDEKNKFQLPTDKERLETYEQIYLDKIKNSGYTLSLDDNKNIVLLDKNGNKAEDQNYVPISFDKFALDIGKKLFPTSVTTPKATPTPPAGGTPPEVGTVPVFKSKQEVSEYLDANITNPKVTSEMLKAAKEQLATLQN